MTATGRSLFGNVEQCGGPSSQRGLVPRSNLISMAEKLSNCRVHFHANMFNSVVVQLTNLSSPIVKLISMAEQLINWFSPVFILIGFEA